MSGRYHVRGQFLATYTSIRADWALAEFTATASSSGISISHLLPLTLGAAYVELHKVLDLTDISVRKKLAVTKHELIVTDWAKATSETITQFIGRTAHQAGFEAILVPSAGGRTNLVLLLENFSTAAILDIINADKLPLNP